MTVRLLCVGDIHLGKGPSRLPDNGLDLTADELGPGGAWSAAVDEALARRVHAVLLAGDVVERIEDQFRAFELLADGARRLRKAGIRIVAVVGNHDVKALPLLAQRVDQVELLGSGDERWEHVRIDGDGGARVDVWGWSFHNSVEPESPLASFPARAARDGSVPTIGLVHADLDASDSRYAPVRSADLRASGLDAWLLGHVHVPSPLSAQAPIGYLGSISALDPGEPGAHGPWSVEVSREGQISFEHIPCAPMRYDTIEVDVSDLAQQPDVSNALAIRLDRAAKDWIEQRSAEFVRVRALALRVRLVGATNDGAALSAAAKDLRNMRLNVDVPAVFVETFLHATRPALDLSELALDRGYRGLIARRLVALEADDTLGRRVVAAARERIESDLAQSRAWRELPDDRRAVGDAELRQRLVLGARRVLEDLVAHRPGGAL